jgi:hypothetical protein
MPSSFKLLYEMGNGVPDEYGDLRSRAAKDLPLLRMRK